jgi:formamidopyrimidine-DNA glycosylase
MAELPEAYIISRQINDTLKGRKITSSSLQNCERLLSEYFVNIAPASFEAALTGRTISGAFCRGKWVIVSMESGQFLLLAPEMGGNILYGSCDSLAKQKYHLKLVFPDNNCFIVKIKGLGFIRLAQKENLESLIYPGKLGICPVDDENFTFENFKSLIEKLPRRKIKDILLDQRNMAGLANSYLNDVMFLAGIHPNCKAGSLNSNEIEKLFQSVCQVVKEAISSGGKSTETDLFGNTGGYVMRMSDKTVNKPCPVCGNEIKKISTSGSSSYVCEVCQILTV